MEDEHRLVPDVDPSALELWYLNPTHRKILNIFWVIAIGWCLLTYTVTQFLVQPEIMNSAILIVVYSTIALMIFGIRIWWIWWCNPQDNYFWVWVKIRLSSAILFFSAVMSLLSVLMIKTSESKSSIFVDIWFTIPLPITAIMLNIVNGWRLLRLWYVWYKQTMLMEQRMDEEDAMYQSVFRSRNGYSETRQEIEAAGIHPAEVEEIQRMELRNARRLLSQFGSRALQNINLLRLILNIDGDRDPEDTEENRVMLFTKITSLPYNKEKHGNHENWAIWCMDYNEDQYVKILPKWNHIFHEDCIEKWILKAKMRLICCPVCRVNIRDEIELQEQSNQVHELHDFNPGNEDAKEWEDQRPSIANSALNLNPAEDDSPESLA